MNSITKENIIKDIEESSQAVHIVADAHGDTTTSVTAATTILKNTFAPIHSIPIHIFDGIGTFPELNRFKFYTVIEVAPVIRDIIVDIIDPDDIPSIQRFTNMKKIKNPVLGRYHSMQSFEVGNVWVDVRFESFIILWSDSPLRDDIELMDEDGVEAFINWVQDGGDYPLLNFPDFNPPHSCNR